MKTKISLLAILVLLTVLISCKKYQLDDTAGSEEYSGTPVLPETPFNYSNSANDNLATLGRVLFYDRNLSLNNSVSCASCHQQNKAFCDNLQFSTGLTDLKTPRNSPSLFAKEGRMFWDGRANDLSSLVLSPIKNHIEMRFENLTELSEKLSKINYYPQLFASAFGSEKVSSSRIGQALNEFLKNFNFSNNKFKRSLKNVDALTASESIGKDIFFGKGNCATCHHLEDNNSFFQDSIGNGYGFTNFDFNIGLDNTYADKGIGEVTGNEFDNGKFMVPVLLNVEYTAPYMHDGRFKTLEDVVEHYNSGIKNHPNLAQELRDFSKIENLTHEEALALFDVNHDGIIANDEFTNAMQPLKLNLTATEKKCLVDFLKTLSDPAIFSEPKFKNPFAVK